MYMMKKQSDWASYGMMEEPFWRNDMTLEEFELERAYLVNIYSRGIKAKINYKHFGIKGKRLIMIHHRILWKL